jgi:hypothetical protein
MINNEVIKEAKKWLQKTNKVFKGTTNFAYFNREAEIAGEFFTRGCHSMFQAHKEKACVIATEVVCTNRNNVNGEAKDILEDYI